MNLLQKLKYLVILPVVCFLSCKTENQNKKLERPNIIYIMADDLTTQAISAYGGIYKDIAPTPNIDKVAKEGMLFQDVLVKSSAMI